MDAVQGLHGVQQSCWRCTCVVVLVCLTCVCLLHRMHMLHGCSLWFSGETMISGVTGEEFAADIFIGPVYYQRLRHMVADKFQVGTDFANY